MSEGLRASMTPCPDCGHLPIWGGQPDVTGYNRCRHLGCLCVAHPANPNFDENRLRILQLMGRL